MLRVLNVRREPPALATVSFWNYIQSYKPDIFHICENQYILYDSGAHMPVCFPFWVS